MRPRFRYALANCHVAPHDPALRGVRDSRVEALIRRYGRAPDGMDSFRAYEPPVEANGRGMGPLVWLEMERFRGGKETWDFAPFPRLVYDANSSQMWPMGGSYIVDARGFRNVRISRRARSPYARLRTVPVTRARHAPSLRKALHDFRDHHNGLDPNEAAMGAITLPHEVVVLGWLRAITYRNDRNDGHGRVNWRHNHGEGWELPMIAVPPAGYPFVLLGGSYSLVHGWIHD